MDVACTEPVEPAADVDAGKESRLELTSTTAEEPACKHQRIDSTAIGTCGGLFVKQGPKKAMKKLEEMTLQESHGVASDENAQNQLLSPRQVLLTDGDQMLKDLQLQPGELRENINIAGLQGGYGILSSGTVLELGGSGGPRLRVSMPCAPCGRIHGLVNTRKRKVNIRDMVMPKRGVFATVLTGGTIRVGDKIAVAAARHESIGFQSKERLAWLVSKCPQGKVVPIRDLLLYIGEFTSWAKAVPAVIRALQKSSPAVPTWRIVDSERRLLKQETDVQLAHLEEEGVPLDKGSKLPIVDESAVWQPTHSELFHGEDAQAPEPKPTSQLQNSAC